MSYTEIVFFGKSGTPKNGVYIKNAFRGAMAVWRTLEEKYLPPFDPNMKSMSRIFTMDTDQSREIWDLVHDSRLSKEERICLVITFDRVIVLRRHFEIIIKAFCSFSRAGSSLPEQALAIEKAMEDESIIAMAWNHTSVNQNRWTDYETDGNAEEWEPYNITLNSDHWVLFSDEDSFSELLEESENG